MSDQAAISTLAPYAVADQASRGRVHDDGFVGDEPTFEIDRRRIVSCMAFRRLMHKTQVFISDVGDHFRTRLTHTLEVVAQAQRLARLLKLNDRLAGAVAMAHDLGHPPFGHAGEACLAELMAEQGGFEHNLQSLRVVDYLEHPYPPFRGLNLSFELREALVKHQTRYDRPDAASARDQTLRPLFDAGPSATLEGQIVNVADAIAYTLHDIEDGLVQGILNERALLESALWGRAAAAIRRQHADAPIAAVRRPILDLIAHELTADIAAASRERIAGAGVASPDDVRAQTTVLVAASDARAAELAALQELLHARLYRHHTIVRMDAKARRFIRELFQAYLDEPALLPTRYAGRVCETGAHRVICDYIAGMTDRFCQREHQRLHAPFHFD